MHNLSVRYMKTGAVVSFLLVVGVLAHFVSDYFQFYGVITVSFITLGTLALTIFNLWLWNKPIISSMYEYPDMSGIYEGTINYVYQDASGKIMTGSSIAQREISQNGSGLFIRSTIYQPNGEVSSVSTSHHVELNKEGPKSIKLIFHFHNEGSATQGYPSHDGTEILRFTSDNGKKHLSGSYYTNRVPYQTKGTIDLILK